jgi:hypothetical protein
MVVWIVQGLVYKKYFLSQRPAQMSPVSDYQADYSMGEASDSNSSLSSHMDVSEGSSDEHEDLFSGASMAKPAFLDN